MGGPSRSDAEEVSRGLETDASVRSKPARRRSVWLIPLLGLTSLAWFLVRVVPKPSRAAYPCQRVAGPLAGGFALWLIGLIGSAMIYRKAQTFFKRSRSAWGCACLMFAAVLGLVTLATMPERRLLADNPTPNTPIGVAKGVQPGRVVWVHDPDATDWNGPGDGHWWDDLLVSRQTLEPKRRTGDGTESV